jgi:hypothetical protein
VKVATKDTLRVDSTDAWRAVVKAVARAVARAARKGVT